jgi:hypothetical protein
MAEKPILFSGPMVRAILEGRKTQSRRIINPQPVAGDIFAGDRILCGPLGIINWCPYLREGSSRLWVREAWYQCIDNNDRIYYAATETPNTTASRHYRKRPSIFLKRTDSRINLEVVDVRVERLNDISEDDAMAEGATPELVPPDGGCFP